MLRPTDRFLAAVAAWGVLVFATVAIEFDGFDALWTHAVTMLTVAFSSIVAGALTYRMWRRGLVSIVIAALLTTAASVPFVILQSVFVHLLNGRIEAIWSDLPLFVPLGVWAVFYWIFSSTTTLVMWIAGAVLVALSARVEHPVQT